MVDIDSRPSRTAIGTTLRRYVTKADYGPGHDEATRPRPSRRTGTGTGTGTGQGSETQFAVLAIYLISYIEVKYREPGVPPNANHGHSTYI